MKKVSFIFITFITLSISLGSFGVFSIFLQQYHASVRNNIENNKNIITDSISINSSQLYINSSKIQWEEDNNEIVYYGILYDIITVKHEKNQIKLYVISDEKEMEYKMCFAQQEDIKNSPSSPIKLLKQFLNLKCVFTNEFIFNSENNTIQSPSGLVCSIPFFITHKGHQTSYTPPPNS